MLALVCRRGALHAPGRLMEPPLHKQLGIVLAPFLLIRCAVRRVP
jgi:hypothetical protein